MANKGKAPMDFRQEELEERAIREQSRLRRERLQRWQDDWASDGFRHGLSNVSITDASPSVVRPPVGGFLPPSPEYTPASPPKASILAHPMLDRPERSPDSRAQRHDRLLQRIAQLNVDQLWRNIEPPIYPSLGPLYSFHDGYYRFRYGTSAEKILAKEIHYAQKPEDEEPSDPSEDEKGRYEASEELSLRTLNESSEDDEEDEVEADVIPDEEEGAEDEEEDELSSEPQSTITDEPSVM